MKRRKCSRFWSLAERLAFYTAQANERGCCLWTGPHDEHYGIVQWEGRNLKAHRAIWQQAHGSIPSGMNVLHKCDVPLCVSEDHLFLGTQLENIADRHTKGRSRAPRGEAQGSAKLTEALIIAIRNDTRSQRVIAAEYGISQSHVWRVRNQETWAHV